MEKILILDYETRSELDIKKSGAYEYSMHPSTRLLCVGWRFGGREELSSLPVKVWSPWTKGDDREELLYALKDPKVILTAHNAFFEQMITRNVFYRGMKKKKPIPVSRWVCTASLGAALGFPRSLELMGKAMRLPIEKDMEGRRLLLKYCKPRKATLYDYSDWHEDVNDIKRIMEYCKIDVEAETELFLRLPPLSDNERRVWELDQKINLRGFQVDREFVGKALSLIAEEYTSLEQRTYELTNGYVESTNQREKSLEWLRCQRLKIDNLQKDTVTSILEKGGLSEDVKEFLEIRQSASKTSTAKYQAFEIRSRTDGRARDNLVYHAASPGRWGGSGIQPQNFPRGTHRDTDLAIGFIKDGMDLETIRILYGNPMALFSSCLRGVISAPTGKELWVADYASIETRCLFWVADYEKGLQAIREKRDLYKEMAASIFNKNVSKVTKEDRQLGKTAILGCGYGMGAEKFLKTCEMQGQFISKNLAEKSVKTYRETHYLVAGLWTITEKAAIFAMKNLSKKIHVNHMIWFKEGDFLYCELPSGRKLSYFKPVIKFKETPWGEKRPTLYHEGLNSVTRKWEEQHTYGAKLVENVVQAIARDLLAEAMLRIEAKGYEITLTVHDEIVAERGVGEGSLKEFCGLMAEVPNWAKDCPIEVEGWHGERYRK